MVAIVQTGPTDLAALDFDIDVVKEALPPPPRLVCRAAPRVKVRGTAAYLSDQRIVIVRSANVSLTGAFVATSNPDPVGTRAALWLEYEKKSLVAEVEVVRVSLVSGPDGRGLGMGLRFMGLTRAQRRFLAAYVAASYCPDEEGERAS